MKNKVLKITVILLLSVLSLNAQEEKKVHMKIVKEVNGEVTTIDTIIEKSDHEGIYFFSDDELDKSKLDSILIKYDIKDKDGKKVLSFTSEDFDTDSANHIWVSVDSDVKMVDGKSGEHVIVKISDGDDCIKTKDHFTILSSDSLEIVKEITINADGEDIYVTKEGDKKVIIKSSGKSSNYVWTVDDDDAEVITLTEKIILEDDEEGTVNVFVTTSDDEDVNVNSDVIIKKVDGKSKTIELYIDADGEDAEAKIKELEKKFKKSGEDVKITKHKTDDGEIMIKVSINEKEESKKDKKK
jgi:phosphotransferase system HPr-like phosphotransfer protein